MQFQLQPTLHHLKTSLSTELFLLNTVSIFQGVTSYETLEPVLKQIKEKAPDVVPFAVTKNFHSI